MPTVFSYASSSIVAELRASTRTVVGPLSFALQEGEKLALIGETGSGKTLTAQAIMGLLPDNLRSTETMVLTASSGSVLKDREIFSEVGRSVVYIPQNGLESLDPNVKVSRHLQDTLRRSGCPRSHIEGEALQRLRDVGFQKPDEIMELYPFQLSGGMAQRVTIALAMTGEARLVIADEPTNGLDRNGRKSFVSLLEKHFPKAGKLLITHDMSLASLADKVLVLKDGVVMEEGPSDLVLSSPRSPYTKALIDALVENGMAETPVLREESICCPFYSRCGEASSACSHCGTREEDGRKWRCIR